MLKIRQMKMEDASFVAAIHSFSWRKAYQHLLPSHYLESLDLAKIEQNWKTGMEVNADVVRLVAVQDGQIIGYAAGLENRSQDLIPAEGELWALYIHPEFWRHHVGTALFEDYSREMLKRNWSRFLIWVLEENQAARSFYQMKGGEIQPHKKVVKYGGEEFYEVAYLFKTI